MAKNKMSDLRDHLFEALERLKDPDLKPDQIQAEIERSKAIVHVAQVVVDTAKVEVDFIEATGQLVEASEFLQLKPRGKAVKGERLLPSRPAVVGMR